METLYLISKLILILLIWAFIILSVLFLLKANKFHNSLKKSEIFFSRRKRDVIHHLVPIADSYSTHSKNIQALLSPPQDGNFLSPLFLLAFKFLTFFESLRFCLILTKKLLRI